LTLQWMGESYKSGHNVKWQKPGILQVDSTSPSDRNGRVPMHEAPRSKLRGIRL